MKKEKGVGGREKGKNDQKQHIDFIDRGRHDIKK